MRWTIHLGLPKAASTSFQASCSDAADAYFVGKLPRLGGSGSLPRYQTDEDRTVLRTILPVCGPGHAPWQRLRAWVEDVERRAMAAGQDHVLVSDEILSGVGFAGMEFGTSLEGVLAVLHRLLGDRATFLLIAREPAGWLRSYYSTRLKQGYSASFASFVTWATSFPYGSALRGVDYRSVVRLAERPELDLRIWLFERFISDAAYREARLAELGLDVAGEGLEHRNRRSDLRRLERLRAWNAVHARDWEAATGALRHPVIQLLMLHDDWRASLNDGDTPDEPLAEPALAAITARNAYLAEQSGPSGPELSYEVPEDVRRELDRILVPGNRLLAAHLGMDLAPFGYGV